MIKLKTRMGSKEFKIKKTKFLISKIPPMKSFALTEYIRVNLAHSADSFSVDAKASEKENAALFFKAILGLDPDVVDRIREELFEYIEFQGSGVDKGWARLTGMEDMAFTDFEVSHIYEVIGRALFINFKGSFSAIMSAFPDAGKFLKSKLPKT